MVVMHSYGGLVGTEAIPEELSYRKRYDRGLAGGVIHLFYFSAMLFREGESLGDVLGNKSRNYETKVK